MEKKLTDEEIVKVLDTCFMAGGNGDCGKCGLFTGNGLGECMRTVAVETLDLIQRQKVEIERLDEENGQLKAYNEGLEFENAELQKQVEELKSQNEMLTDKCERAFKYTAKEVLQDIYNMSTCILYYGKMYRAIETVRFDGIVRSNGVEVG